MGRRSGREATKRSNGRNQPARARSGRPGKVKVCQFCAARAAWVDYKDVATLRRLMSDRGKIKARRVTGTCRQHQRDVSVAIKTARELALLPYALSPNAEKFGRNGRPREAQSAARTEAEAEAAPPTAEHDSSERTDDLPVEDQQQDSAALAVETAAVTNPPGPLPPSP